MKIKNYINRIAFILDESSSMNHLRDTVIQVVDAQVKHLAETSKQMDQETRVSVYSFSDDIRNLIWDKDCLRLPSLKGIYKPNGCTNLIEATLKVIEDFKKSVPLYGEASNVIFCLSDGQCNRNTHLANNLREEITNLPEEWTIVFLAPDAVSIAEAKRYGFPANNIQRWETTKKGLEEVGEKLKTATQNFMVARSQGIRSTKSLFTLDASNLTKSQVINNLIELSPREYDVIPVRKDAPIKEYVENYTKTPYTIGSGFYFLNKKEAIQPNKAICIRNKMNGKVYSGNNARKLIGLPDYEVKVEPANHGDYEIFVKSSSVNRKLIKGTDLIIIK